MSRGGCSRGDAGDGDGCNGGGRVEGSGGGRRGGCTRQTCARAIAEEPPIGTGSPNCPLHMVLLIEEDTTNEAESEPEDEEEVGCTVGGCTNR